MTSFFAMHTLLSTLNFIRSRYSSYIVMSLLYTRMFHFKNTQFNKVAYNSNYLHAIFSVRSVLSVHVTVLHYTACVPLRHTTCTLFTCFPVHFSSIYITLIARQLLMRIRSSLTQFIVSIGESAYAIFQNVSLRVEW